MNLENERNYQKLLETLDSLELTENNRNLAESYLDMSKEEDQSLLSQAEHQDFTKLKSAAAGNGYVEYLQKRKRLEEYGRYVRFVAAVGGATAQRVLSHYYDTSKYLSPEQWIAVKAQNLAGQYYTMVWSSLESLYEMGKKTPKVFLDAMDLCWQEEGNTRLLLAAVYLRAVPAAEPLTEAQKGQGPLKGLFAGKDERRPDVLRALQVLESGLAGGLDVLLPQASGAEREALRAYIEGADLDTPIPEDVIQACNGMPPADQYLMRLLAGTCFLAFDHSRKVFASLKILILVDADMALASCEALCPEKLGNRYKTFLEKHLDTCLVRDYISWSVRNASRTGYGKSALARLSKQYPDVVRELLPSFRMEEYSVLLEGIKAGNPELYKSLSGSAGSALYREKVVGEVTKWCKDGGLPVLQKYLLGEEDLEAVLPYVEGWLETDRASWGAGVSSDTYAEIRNSDEQQLYRRVLVMLALRRHGYYFTHYTVKKASSKNNNSYCQGLSGRNMREILEVLEEEGLSMHYQIYIMEGMHDCLYSDKDKALLIDLGVEALAEKAAAGEDFVREAKEGSALIRLICVRVLDKLGDGYKEALVACAADSSLQVRESLTAIYESHRDWEPEVKKMLASRKSQERELAIAVLKKWGAENYKEEFRKALEIEKSKKLKALLGELLGVAEEDAPSGENRAAQGPEQLAAELLKGSKKRKVAWAYETPFPQVHRTDGSLVEDEYLQALLVVYADMSTPGMSADAAKLAAELNPSELAVYMERLFGKWIESGAEAKKKWVLYAASIHGREKTVPLLYRQIQEWPENARGAMAAEAVKALALNSSADALVMVDQIARKFKFRQVKAAAGAALSYAAEQLGISRDELEDRIVPNLGFDQKMEQIFDYGDRLFRVYLSPSLEVEVFDENGKKLKNLPAPGKKDDEAKAQAANNAFKLMKKQLKTVVGNQKLRLEQAMSVERLWTVEKWQEFFVKNPVMHQFAIGLIWGLYEDYEASHHKELKATFRYMEDGSFNTVDEEEYELPQEGLIGLVHPIELDEEALSAWKEQLADYEVTQPIEQLERAVYRPTEEEKGENELTRFGGKMLPGVSLSGKLLDMGWYRGSVLDGGGYYNFYREDGSTGVELEFSGSYVGGDYDDVTVYEAVFYQTGIVKREGWHDEVKKEHRMKLEDVNPRYFSEMVLQLTRATASSQEQLPYPQCRDDR